MEWVREQWTKLYWFFHGPVGHTQPHQKGYVNMSGEAIVRFLVVEAVLFIVLMLALLGVRRFISDAEVQKWVTALVVVLFGGAMIIVLFRFLGVF